ncbi:uncharacterized protein [Chelonus insularis]|uniref:uncharacterized protein n=1 Tax=Chelonus insularis TaxID=460826 RepID=UPI00158F0781|nr:uncharacterized protein LOC118064999 [Chelonus insularis]
MIQETWMKADQAIKLFNKTFVEHKCWAKGAIKHGNSNRGRLSGGQVLMIRRSQFREAQVSEWEYGLVIKAKKGLAIISVYLNEGVAKAEQKLKEVIEDCASGYELVFICGDLNARVGQEQGDAFADEESLRARPRRSSDKVLNSEGKRVLKICEELGLILLNGRVDGDMDGNVTYTGGYEMFEGSVLDLIFMVDRNNSHVVKKLEVIKRIESDHMPVTFVFDVGGENEGDEELGTMISTGNKVSRIYWKTEASDKFQEVFVSKMQNISKDWDWSAIKEIFWSTADEVGLTRINQSAGDTNRGPKVKSLIYTEDCKKLRSEVWKLLNEWLKDRIAVKKKCYIECRKKLHKMISEGKRKWLEDKWRELSRARGMTEWWGALNKFRGKTKSVVVGDISEQQWVHYFCGLLNYNRGGSTEVREVSPWSVEAGESLNSVDEGLDDDIAGWEVAEALKKMASGKASGEDGIPIECLKQMNKHFAELLKECLNRIWNEGILPPGWEKARIVPIFKEGDENKPENYRGISLLDSGYKLLTCIMAERLNCWLDKERSLRESQAGFRKKRGTRDHIFVLNALINNRLKVKRGKLYVAFIDFRAAFDTVDRQIMLKKVWSIGVRGKFHKLIREIYRTTKAEVKVNGVVSAEFLCRVGVRQGCALSSALFDIFIDDIDEIWERNKEGGTVMGKAKVRALKYADDIAIVAESGEELTKMLKSLEKYVDKNRLEVNVRKTKIMVFKNGGRSKDNEKWYFKENTIEVVKEFKYLGYWFTAANKATVHMERMASKAQKATNATWGLFKRAGRDLKGERIYLMETIVRAMAVYGVEIWGLGKIERLQKVQSRYCKAILGVARNTPKYIWRNEIGVKEIEFILKERACRYLWEVLEMDDDRWPKICLLEEVRGILNNKESAWGKAFAEFCYEIEDTEIIQDIRNGVAAGAIAARFACGLDKLERRYKNKEWDLILRSTYNPIYAILKPGDNGAVYWNQRIKNSRYKEIWARIRCGNVGRGGKKGWRDWSCRLCGWCSETLCHLLCCSEAIRPQSEKIKKFLIKWKGDQGELEIQSLIVELLKGNICFELCEFVEKVECELYGRR